MIIAHSFHLQTERRMGKNFIIFGADMSSSVHIDNNVKDILILGEGPTQRLDDTTLTAETIYPINIIQSNKRFVLSLHYNGNNSFLFVNTTKLYQLHSVAKFWVIFQKILQLII